MEKIGIKFQKSKIQTALAAHHIVDIQPRSQFDKK